MHAVILAAGEGSRMGERTGEVPKAFMTIGDRTLYERQRALLSGFVDGVTVVLGYAAENVREATGDARVVVVEDWREYENAESLRRGLAGLDDDTLVLNGDVLLTRVALAHLLDRFEAAGPGRSAVACLPGLQEGETAVACDDEGLVTDYGLIHGHRHAGVGVVADAHRRGAREHLADNREEWYPGIYTVVDTLAVPVPADHHVEINEPADVVEARSKLPLSTADLP